MHEGVPCDVDPTRCCYNEDLWCPGGGPHCDRYDRGAYPVGDKAIFADQMTDPDALSPFPNAIVWNWVTVFATTVGSIGTLDLEARCLAGTYALNPSCSAPPLHPEPDLTCGLATLLTSLPFRPAKTPRIAKLSFIIAGVYVLIVVLPLVYIGAITRYDLS
jgi:hypothetical protein